MRRRVTVVCLSVCMYVCKRSNCSSADLCHPNVVLPESARYLQDFSLVNFAKMALFKSYAVIYLSIDAAICNVLQVSHTLSIFYCAARATFDRLSIRGPLSCRARLSPQYIENPYERVSVRDWLKHSFDCKPAQMDAGLAMYRYNKRTGTSKFHLMRTNCSSHTHAC